MVLDNVDYTAEQKRTTDSAADSKSASKKSASNFEARLASPVDRLAANIADMVIFLPVMAVIAAPFRRHALEAQLTGNENGWLIAMLSAGVAGLIAFIVYQSAFVSLWGATPGKRAIGIRVEPLWNDRPDRRSRHPQALSAFLRALVWAFEALLLGLPWFAVFGNERRRPFHDRVADTVVVVNEKRAKAVGVPTWQELSLGSGLTLAMLTALSVVVTFELAKRFHGSDTGGALASELEEEGALCPVVGRAEREWVPVSGEKTPPRLSIALSLFATGTIDDDCLKQEGDFAFWHSDDSSASYLAKGLSQTDSQEHYHAYLDKTCEEDSDSDACKVAHLLSERVASVDADKDADRDADSDERDVRDVRAVELKRETEIASIIGSVGLKSEPYLKIWAIRQLTESKRFERALTLIDQFSVQRNLGYFLASERAKALWQLDRKNDAHLAMRASIDAFEPAQRLELARWFCARETSVEGCSQNAVDSCGLLGAVAEKFDERLSEPEVAVAYLRSVNCKDKTDATELASIEKKVSDVDGKSYIEALLKLKKNDTHGAVLELHDLMQKSEGPFVTEAGFRLLDLASDKKSLDEVRETWVASDSEQEGWSDLGHKLLVKLNAAQAWNAALEVGVKLSESGDVDATSARALVVAAYKAGQTRVALGFLDRVNEQNAAVRALRVPASEPATDAFNEIAKSLSAMRGQR